MKQETPDSVVEGSGAPKLEDQAIAWVISVHSGQISQADRIRLADWLSEHPEHRQAYAEAQRLWADMGVAMDAPGPESVARKANGRRDFARSSRSPRLRAAAAAVLLVVAGWSLHRAHVTDAWLSDHYTVIGEQRSIGLNDGSQVTLDTGTAIQVQFEPTSRLVRLMHGRAVFHVAPDAAKPFSVDADGLTTVALGTVFEVDAEQGHVRVMVQEHAVAVGPTASSDKSVRVEEGHFVVFRPGGQLESSGAADLSAATAWQRRKFIFNERPLANVVEELNRYRQGRVVLLGQALRQLKVTGVFPIESATALQTLQTSLGLKASVLGPITLLYR